MVLGDQRPQLLGGQGAYMLVQAREVGHEHGYGLGRETGTFDRVQRWEVVLEPLNHKLEDSLRPLDALQTVLAKIEQTDALKLLVCSEAAVERDSSTCPPWPTAQIRLARVTPIPT